MEDDPAATSTRLLRVDAHPMWARLRDLLRERGLDPDHVAIADLFPDDTDMEFGIVVVPDGQVFEFDLVYGRGDLNTAAATAIIGDWRDRTDSWRDSPFRPQIESAFRFLDRTDVTSPRPDPAHRDGL